MTEAEWRTNFADRLTYMIQKRGCTQSEFAEEVGISEKSLNHYIRGVRTPKANILAAIANELGCDPKDLLYF